MYAGALMIFGGVAALSIPFITSTYVTDPATQGGLGLAIVTVLYGTLYRQSVRGNRNVRSAAEHSEN